MVEIIYGIIRIAPQRWWIIAWAVFVGLFLLMAQLAPVVLLPIFYKFEPLENDGLRERLTKLGERAGTRVRGVYEWKLSEKSKKANAALTGMGSTRRIILSDTLLQNYSDDEIEAVLAHELGHHVHRHILKGIFMQVAITFFGFWLINQVLRFVIGARDWFPALDPRLYDFANLPLIVLVVTVLGFLLMPALNAVSRRHEREADRYAWENIPAHRAVHQLDAEAGRSEPCGAYSRSKLIEVLFHSHPSIGKRVAAAETWAGARQPASSHHWSKPGGPAELLPLAAGLPRCPRPRCRTAFRPRGSARRDRGSVAAPAARCAPDPTLARCRRHPARACDRHRSQDV